MRLLQKVLHKVLCCTPVYLTTVYTDSITMVQEEILILENIFAKIEEATFNAILETRSTVQSFLDISIHFLEDIGSYIDRDLPIDSIWDRMSLYWDFHSYGYMKHLIDKLGQDNLKILMKDYLVKLKNFQSTTLLSDFARYSVKIGTDLPDLSDVTVQLNQQNKDYKLKELDEIIVTISSKFSLPRLIVILKSIKLNLLTVTWALPTKVVVLLNKSLSDDNCMINNGHYVSLVTIAGKECKYSPLDCSNTRKSNRNLRTPTYTSRFRSSKFVSCM